MPRAYDSYTRALRAWIRDTDRMSNSYFFELILIAFQARYCIGALPLSAFACLEFGQLNPLVSFSTLTREVLRTPLTIIRIEPKAVCSLITLVLLKNQEYEREKKSKVACKHVTEDAHILHIPWL
jgi:hypothetical protein